MVDWTLKSQISYLTCQLVKRMWCMLFVTEDLCNIQKLACHREMLKQRKSKWQTWVCCKHQWWYCPTPAWRSLWAENSVIYILSPLRFGMPVDDNKIKTPYINALSMLMIMTNNPTRHTTNTTTQHLQTKTHYNMPVCTHTHTNTHTHLSLIHIWRCRRTG